MALMDFDLYRAGV